MLALSGLLAGLLAGCAGSTPAAATVPGQASGHPTTAGPTTGRSDADRYPLGLTVFPVGQRRALPALQGRTLAGPALALSSLRGRTVVLTVWASWCEPCRTELPGLATLAAQVRASGVRFVGLDEDTDPGAAASAVRSTRSAYPHLVDRGTLLARLSPWLPAAVPGSLVVDPQGRVAARVVGPVTAAQLRPLLAGLAPV
ncbi:MAG: TlpA family protein disulfide reductase [Oryzihumus sp.]